MKNLFVALTGLFLVCGLSFASPPVINNNVTVIQNAQPAQCTPSWQADRGPDIEQVDTSYGSGNVVSSPAVRSCTGCAIVGSDCVCKTCYDRFDE